MKKLTIHTVFVSMTLLCAFVIPHTVFASPTSNFSIEIAPLVSDPPPGSSSGGSSSGGGGFFQQTHKAIVEKIREVLEPELAPLSEPPTLSVEEDGERVYLVWDFSWPDALHTKVTVTISRTVASNIADVVVKPVHFDRAFAAGVTRGVMYDISVFNAQGRGVYTFAEPPTFSVTVPENMRLLPHERLGVYYFDSESELWRRIENTVFSGDTVTFSTNHFSLFGIFIIEGDLPESILPALEGSAVPPYAATTRDRTNQIAEGLAIVFYILILSLLAAIAARMARVVSHLTYIRRAH